MSNFTELWSGGPLVQNRAAFPVGTDAVVLADFAAGTGAKRVLDLGCGGGCIAMTLAHGNENVTAVGVEIDSAAADEARENIAASGLSGRVSIITADFRTLGERDLGGRFELVVSNPPYFSASAGGVSASHGAARSDMFCTLGDLVAAGARLTKNGGKFCFVYRPERLAEAVSLLREARLEPKRMRFVHATVSSPPSAVLIECRLGGGTGVSILPPLILRDGAGDTAEARRIYRMT